MKSVIFMALLVVGSFAVQSQNQKFLELNAQVLSLIDMHLEDIQNSAIGRSIAGLIALKMKVGDNNYDRLFEVFDQLTQFLEDQRTLNTEEMASRTTEHTGLMNNYATVLSEQLEIVNTNQFSLLTLSGDVTMKQNLVDNNDIAISANLDIMDSLDVVRKVQNDAYNSERPRIVAAVEGCNAALACLEKLVASEAGFIQVREQQSNMIVEVKKVINQLKDMKSTKKHARMFAQILRTAQEYTDQSALEKVMTLITDLRADLIGLLATKDATEAAAIAAYDGSYGTFDELNMGYESENTQLETDLTALRAAVTAAETAVSTAQEKTTEYEGKETDETVTFNAFSTAHFNRNAKIDAELAYLRMVQVHLAAGGVTPGM